MTIDNVTDDAAWYYLRDCFAEEANYKQLMLDGFSKYKLLDTFNSLNSEYEDSNMCLTLSNSMNLVSTDLRASNVTLDNCLNVYNGILTNGGLTETLFHFLRNIEDILIRFADRKAQINGTSELNRTKELLLR